MTDDQLHIDGMGSEVASFTDHVLFQELIPHLYIEPARNPRYRIELHPKTPRRLVREALAAVTPCPRCGLPMHPFRIRQEGQRAGSHSRAIYFGATCQERAPERTKMRWRTLALSDLEAVNKEDLAAALLDAVSYPRYCSKGDAASKEYDAVVAAVVEVRGEDAIQKPKAQPEGDTDD